MEGSRTADIADITSPRVEAKAAEAASPLMSPPTDVRPGAPGARLEALEARLINLMDLLEGRDAQHAAPAQGHQRARREGSERLGQGGDGAVALDRLAEVEAARLEKVTPLQLKDFPTPKGSAPCFKDIEKVGFSEWSEYDDAWEPDLVGRLMHNRAHQLPFASAFVSCWSAQRAKEITGSARKGSFRCHYATYAIASIPEGGASSGNQTRSFGASEGASAYSSDVHLSAGGGP